MITRITDQILRELKSKSSGNQVVVGVNDNCVVVRKEGGDEVKCMDGDCVGYLQEQ